jgi:putative pyruvate formate lyase activating enzyme
MVRILVLPEHTEGAKCTLRHLKRAFSTELCISLMAQYTPVFKAHTAPPLHRSVLPQEYDEVVDCALALGFTRLWLQEPEAAHVGVPDFDADSPFHF